MSAELLREAATKMREGAEAATPGPWDAVEGASGEWWVELRNTADVAIDLHGANAEHIASWHPAVALAVADWLDRSAYLWEYGDIGTANKEHALAVARAYLGEEA